MSDFDINYISEQDLDFDPKVSLIRPRLKSYRYQWDISLLSRSILAIVWPRLASSYGKQVVEHTIKTASSYDLVTISWMASWIDSYCHSCSIQHGIPTIAVLGWGISRYRQHKNLSMMDKILWWWGLIISEYDPDLSPQSYSFQQRNRIIAGLSDLVIVPEASRGSWSLITVDFAISMHKPVYGAPQQIFSSIGRWVLDLISDKQISMLYDVPSTLSQYFLPRDWSTTQHSHISTYSLSQIQQSILSWFGSQTQQDIDTIASYTDLDISELITQLSILEMEGMISQTSPWVYVLEYSAQLTCI